MALAAVATAEHEPAGPEKRPGAFRTISEVAEELAVPQHVLRFWESRFAQVRPVKRAGGRRYYRPEDVELLNGIRRLLHGQGYTIRGAQRVLKERGLRFVQAVGRGEAEPGVPTPGERAVEDETAGPEARAETEAGLDPTAQGLLRDLLRELHACRDALAALRSEPPATP